MHAGPRAGYRSGSPTLPSSASGTGRQRAANRAAAPPRRRRRKTAWGRAWARAWAHDEGKAKFARFAIAFSLFLALLAAALLVGGNVVVDPLLQSVAAAREAKRAGDIVVSLPDRAFCQHLSFDNTTAELTAGDVEPCPGDLASRHAQTGFAWGGR